MDSDQQSNDNLNEKERLDMGFIRDDEVTNIQLLSEEQRNSILDRMFALSREVKAGRVTMDDAAAILIKPPFNIASIHRARRVLDPGPPTP